MKHEGNGNFRGCLVRSGKWWRRNYWSGVRAEVLVVLKAGRWDDLPGRHRHSVLWDYF